MWHSTHVLHVSHSMAPMCSSAAAVVTCMGVLFFLACTCGCGRLHAARAGASTCWPCACQHGGCGHLPRGVFSPRPPAAAAGRAPCSADGKKGRHCAATPPGIVALHCALNCIACCFSATVCAARVPVTTATATAKCVHCILLALISQECIGSESSPPIIFCILINVFSKLHALQGDQSHRKGSITANCVCQVSSSLRKGSVLQFVSA